MNVMEQDLAQKRVAKSRERGRIKEGGRQSAIIHIFAIEAC